MMETHYPYILPEGVVWSARTGRLMTVAEAAAELERQGGGGGGGTTPVIDVANPITLNWNDVIPAGLWLAEYLVPTENAGIGGVPVGLIVSDGVNVQWLGGSTDKLYRVTFA